MGTWQGRRQLLFGGYCYPVKIYFVEGRAMNTRYDIYKRLPEDRLLWVNRVIGLDEARKLVAALQTASMDSYLVYDFRERTVVEVFKSEQKSAGQIAA
jgi:hypothetical protein